jgi:hypothetical protein
MASSVNIYTFLNWKMSFFDIKLVASFLQQKHLQKICNIFCIKICPKAFHDLNV